MDAETLTVLAFPIYFPNEMVRYRKVLFIRLVGCDSLHVDLTHFIIIMTRPVWILPKCSFRNETYKSAKPFTASVTLSVLGSSSPFSRHTHAMRH